MVTDKHRVTGNHLLFLLDPPALCPNQPELGQLPGTAAVYQPQLLAYPIDIVRGCLLPPVVHHHAQLLSSWRMGGKIRQLTSLRL